MSGLWRILAAIPAFLALGAMVGWRMAVNSGDESIMHGFVLTAIICAALALILRLGERGVQHLGSVRSALLLIMIVWLGTPALAAIPLAMASPQTPYILAYSDAMAQLTTTGGQILSFASDREPVIFWRGLLQWLGGYLSILLALAVLAPLYLTGPGVYRSSLLSVDKEDLSNRIGTLALIVASVYGMASLGLLIWLLLAGAPFFDAMIAMFGSVSTGGILPGASSFDAIAGRIGAWGGAMGMLIGATSFTVHWELHRGRILHFSDPETLGVLAMAALSAVMLFLMGAHLSPAILNGISLATTNAAPMTPGGTGLLPLPITMSIVLVGGAALSTAGGVKVIRFLMLFRRTGSELFKLSHPSAVSPTRFRGQTIPESSFTNLWVYVLGYAGALGFLIVVVAAFGADFEEASNAAVAAISNAGPSFLAGPGGPGDFSHLSPPALLALSLGMALGRVEILAVLALLSPEFWRE
ncbi:MAG: potassium transporter TrkG [Robiginitomaculum sp.]|nr:potassium transporter TrkG [Robiginitomaculum sp.]MDQ7078217.1 potassium transporter TrkG [Robiginitomaculum sp.]